MNLAYTYAELGEMEKALSVIREAYDNLEEAYGEDDEQTLQAEENYICILRDSGNVKKASSKALNAYTRRMNHFGWESEEAGRMMQIMASLVLADLDDE